MLTRKVGARGKVTLGRNLLTHMGVRSGDSINVEMLSYGALRLEAEKATARPTGNISDIFGFLKREAGPSLSIDEINEISGPLGKL